MTVEKWIPEVQLKSGGDSRLLIRALLPAEESDAVVFVDMYNSSLKHVFLSSGTVKELYRSSGGYFLRGAAFVADGKRHKHSLLLVEMPCNAADKTRT